LVDTEGRARLTDMTVIEINDVLNETTTCESRGSIRWIAPELIDPEEFGIPANEESVPTPASDMFALGMTIYEVCGCKYKQNVSSWYHRCTVVYCRLQVSAIESSSVVYFKASDQLDRQVRL
jgi:serine/threonine protein kinase